MIMIASNGHFCGTSSEGRVCQQRRPCDRRLRAARGLITAPRRVLAPNVQLGHTRLDANAAADAELLRQERNLAGRRDLNAQLANLDHRAALLALLLALLRLALVLTDNGNARQLLSPVVQSKQRASLCFIDCRCVCCCEKSILFHFDHFQLHCWPVEAK